MNLLDYLHVVRHAHNSQKVFAKIKADMVLSTSVNSCETPLNEEGANSEFLEVSGLDMNSLPLV